MQGAKKIIFTASHSGKLKLAFTSPDIISTSPKSFLTSRIDLTVLPSFKFRKQFRTLLSLHTAGGGGGGMMVPGIPSRDRGNLG